MPASFLALLFLSMAGMAFLNGCSSDSAVASAAKSAFTLSSARVWLEKVKFKVSADVNNNAPVTVHLLIIYDQDAFSKFSTLPADLYFKDQKQYKKDFGTGKVDFFSWEVVPGQNLNDQPVAPS